MLSPAPLVDAYQCGALKLCKGCSADAQADGTSRQGLCSALREVLTVRVAMRRGHGVLLRCSAHLEEDREHAQHCRQAKALLQMQS